MHEASGSIRKSLKRDEKADEQHQAASVEVTLAH
jgi:hypothetical protein